MKKSILLLACVMALYADVQSQSTNDVLRSWFINLQPAPDPAPFLIDMVARESDDKWFSAKNYTDTNTLNNWWMMYYEMQHASYVPNLLPETFGLKYQALQQAKTDTIPIGIIDLEYNEFKLEALSDSGVYFGWDDNGFWDIPSRKDHPYTYNEENPAKGTRHDVFAAAPLQATSDFKDVVFKIDPSFIFYGLPYNYETQLPPTHIAEINLGDGSGWQQFNPSQVKYINVMYPKSGLYTIQVRVHQDMGDIRYSQAKFGVLTNKTRKNPDEIITEIPGINAGIYYPCNLGADYEKIVIAVSGFDFNDNKGISDIYDQMIAESQIMMLHNYGYAIVVVDFADSKKKVQDNSQSLISLIELLKCRQGMKNTVHHNFTIASISLGSVITRHALASMETPAYKASVAANPDRCHPEQSHNVRTWLCLEAENEGAFVPIAGQGLIQFAHNQLQAINRFSAYTIENMITQLDWAYTDLLQKDATKQLLTHHIDQTDRQGRYIRHTLGQQLQAELDALGYPKECKSVALTNALTDCKKQVAYVDIPAFEGLKYLDLDMELDVRILKIFKLKHGISLELKAPPASGTGNVLDVRIKYPKFYNSPIGCIYKTMKAIKVCLSPPPVILACPLFVIDAISCMGSDYITSSLDVVDAVPHGIMQGGAIHYAAMVHQPRADSDILTVSTGALASAFGVPGGAVDIPVGSYQYSQVPGNGSSSAAGHLEVTIADANLDAVVSTQATAINFVPWYSALGYERYDSLNQDLSNTPIDSNLARVPYDVVVGRQSNNYPKSTVPDNQGEQHFSHFHFRKDSVSGGPDLTFLTREIGETYQHLDNQTIDRQSWFEAEHEVNAGAEASLIWDYPNQTSQSIPKLEAQWSKEAGFDVTTNGYAHLKAGKEVRLQPGFSVSNGGELHAWIEPLQVCNYTLEELDTLYNSASVAPPPAEGTGAYTTETSDTDGALATALQSAEQIDEAIRVYPNPTSSSLTVVVPSGCGYTLTSVEGRLVQRGSLAAGKNQIDVLSLTKGIYTLHLIGSGTQPYKIIKQ